MTEETNSHLKSNGDHKDEYLFDNNLLQSIFKNYSLKDSKLHDNIYDEKYQIRPLKISDYDQGYIELLRQLTECGTITYEDYKQRFNQLKQCLNTYYILIIEDLNIDKQIVGTATLVCERKFIRQLGIRGRIEDVVVDNRCRGQQLGKLLIHLLTDFAREKCDCYKISLECKDHLVSFYQQFGYDHEDKQNFLCQRFKHLSTNQQDKTQ
jgi:glucosamine-phosphate N-acetyltransferase